MKCHLSLKQPPKAVWAKATEWCNPLSLLFGLQLVTPAGTLPGCVCFQPQLEVTTVLVCLCDTPWLPAPPLCLHSHRVTSACMPRAMFPFLPLAQRISKSSWILRRYIVPHKDPIVCDSLLCCVPAVCSVAPGLEQHRKHRAQCPRHLTWIKVNKLLTTTQNTCMNLTNSFSSVWTGAGLKGPCWSLTVQHILWFWMSLENKVLTLPFEPFIAKSQFTTSSQNYGQDYAL